MARDLLNDDIPLIDSFTDCDQHEDLNDGNSDKELPTGDASCSIKARFKQMDNGNVRSRGGVHWKIADNDRPQESGDVVCLTSSKNDSNAPPPSEVQNHEIVRRLSDTAPSCSFGWCCGSFLVLNVILVACHLLVAVFLARYWGKDPCLPNPCGQGEVCRVVSGDVCAAGVGVGQELMNTYCLPYMCEAPGANVDSCQFLPVRGPCKGHVSAWYFNISTGQCETFDYSGCGGNANRFGNAEDCMAECDVSEESTEDLCLLPPVAGPCGKNISAWYFNMSAYQCQPFTYSGCGGNLNRFERPEDCRLECDHSEQPEYICRDIPREGKCRLPQEKWYFNAHQGRCLAFTYGGCGASRNSFDTEAQCQEFCANVPAQIHPRFPKKRYEMTDYFELMNVTPEYGDIHPICQPLPERGPCKASLEYWYYDLWEEKCANFTYGGCGGNKNKFETEEDCQRRCPRRKKNDRLITCYLKPQPGKCKGTKRRWYYDLSSDRCRRFSYSGCGGNFNRFLTKQKCYHFCDHLEDNLVTLRHPGCHKVKDRRTNSTILVCT